MTQPQDMYSIKEKILKRACLKLPNEKDREIAAKWMKKFRQCDRDEDAEKREHLMDLFNLSLNHKMLVGPFAVAPDNTNTLDEWDQQFTIMGISDLIQQKKKADQGNCPIQSEVSGGLNEYTAFQEIPGHGLQFFYGIGEDVIPNWVNGDGVLLPKLQIDPNNVLDGPENSEKLSALKRTLLKERFQGDGDDEHIMGEFKRAGIEMLGSDDEFVPRNQSNRPLSPSRKLLVDELDDPKLAKKVMKKAKEQVHTTSSKTQTSRISRKTQRERSKTPEIECVIASETPRKFDIPSLRRPKPLKKAQPAKRTKSRSRFDDYSPPPPSPEKVDISQNLSTIPARLRERLSKSYSKKVDADKDSRTSRSESRKRIPDKSQPTPRSLSARSCTPTGRRLDKSQPTPRPSSARSCTPSSRRLDKSQPTPRPSSARSCTPSDKRVAVPRTPGAGHHKKETTKSEFVEKSPKDQRQQRTPPKNLTRTQAPEVSSRKQQIQKYLSAVKKGDPTEAICFEENVYESTTPEGHRRLQRSRYSPEVREHVPILLESSVSYLESDEMENDDLLAPEKTLENFQGALENLMDQLKTTQEATSNFQQLMVDDNIDDVQMDKFYDAEEDADEDMCEWYEEEVEKPSQKKPVIKSLRPSKYDYTGRNKKADTSRKTHQVSERIAALSRPKSNTDITQADRRVVAPPKPQANQSKYDYRGIKKSQEAANTTRNKQTAVRYRTDALAQPKGQGGERPTSAGPIASLRPSKFSASGKLPRQPKPPAAKKSRGKESIFVADEYGDYHQCG